MRKCRYCGYKTPNSVCPVCGKTTEELKKYRFEIQKCIDVVIEDYNQEAARMQIIENIDGYAERLINDAYVSDGVEMK